MPKFNKDHIVDNGQQNKRQPDEDRIYTYSLQELSEQEDTKARMKDDMCMVTSRDMPTCINRLVTDAILLSTGWNIKNKLSRKRVFLYTSKLGQSCIAHGEYYKEIEHAYTRISSACTDEEDLSYSFLDVKPPSLVTKMSMSELGNTYNVFENTSDWISNNCVHLGLSRCDLTLYCVLVGFSKMEIRNPLHLKLLNESLAVFETYLKRRTKILQLGES